jgi:hypothetical protein
MFSILKEGTIPLVAYDAFDDSEYVSIVKCQPDAKYVAVRHVWSHGLGNPHDNSLPLCQMQRISSMIDALNGSDHEKPVLFWIDTLCCPTQPDEATDLAIIQMRATYANADKVGPSVKLELIF